MSTPRLRIATYNLQKCIGLDFRRRPDRSLQVIKAIQADVVVLQEADKRLPPRPAALPHRMIEDQGWCVLPFGAPEGSLGWHGNAMLTAPDVDFCATGHIELPGLEPRGAIFADLDTQIGAIRVVGLHLGLLRRYRLLQLSAIIRNLRRLSPLHTVLAGDFNEWGTGRDLVTATDGLKFVSTPPSFPALRPIAKLDRIALSAELTSLAAGSFRGRPAGIASDHLPVWVDIVRRELGHR